MSEFLLFLKNQRKESMQRLKELTEFPIVYSAAEQGEKPLNPIRYLPPRIGQIKLTIIDGFTQKDSYRVISPEDKTNILKVAEQSGELLTMTSFGVKNYKIRLHEALNIVDSLLKESNNRVQVLANVLPQMASPNEAKLLVNKILQNLTDLNRLKREIGQFYRVIMGTPDGYYHLDLSNEMDRFCVNRLLEISMTTAHFRSQKRNVVGYGKLGDTSQKNNFTCFRNEMLNKKPTTITVDFASPLPKAGKLEFDFVSQKRYKKDNFIISDIRFTNLLVKNFQIPKTERTKLIKLLIQIKKLCNRTIHGNGRRIFEIPNQAAMEMGECMGTFYSKLGERLDQNERYRAKESVKMTWEYDANKIQLRMGNFHKIYKIPSFFERKIPIAQEIEKMTAEHATRRKQAHSGAAAPAEHLEEERVDQHEDEEYDEETESEEEEEEDHGDANVDEEGKSLLDDIYKPVEDDSLTTTTINGHKINTKSAFEEMVLTIVEEKHQSPEESKCVTPSSSRRGLRKAISKKEIPLSETFNRYICLMASKNVPSQFKASKTLELLIETFEGFFLLSRQMLVLLIIFEELGLQRTSDDFSTYRVELLVTLFSNIVDLHNLEIIFQQLTSFELACLHCRLGYLNLFNPMKPEGSFQLDLSRYEERQVVKMLAHLSVVEPGDNLPFLQFRWERDMDCMPGYELTELWMTEDGLPKKGLWDATYYAGEGKLKKGCKPAIKARKALLQLVSNPCLLHTADLILILILCVRC